MKTLTYQILIFISLSLGATLPASAQTITMDQFLAADYGNSQIPLTGNSGGQGWNGAWSANANIQYDPSANLTRNTTGWNVAVNNPGGVETTIAGTFAGTRSYSSTTVTSDFVWFSFVGNRASASSTSDRLGITLTDGTNNVFIGNRANDFGLGNIAGFLNVDQADNIYTASVNHLTIGKIDLTNGSVSAWLDPIDATSEVTLGTATVFGDATDFGFTLSSLNGNLEIRFGENGAQRVSFDDFRIAYGDDSAATYANLAAAIPEPSTAGLLCSAGLILAWRRSRLL